MAGFTRGGGAWLQLGYYLALGRCINVVSSIRPTPSKYIWQIDIGRISTCAQRRYVHFVVIVISNCTTFSMSPSQSSTNALLRCKKKGNCNGLLLGYGSSHTHCKCDPPPRIEASSPLVFPAKCSSSSSSEKERERKRVVGRGRHRWEDRERERESVCVCVCNIPPPNIIRIYSSFVSDLFGKPSSLFFCY